MGGEKRGGERIAQRGTTVPEMGGAYLIITAEPRGRGRKGKEKR